MSQPNARVAVVGIDIGKDSFHIVGQDRRGEIVLRQKWSRSQVEARFANMSACLIGMEACVGRIISVVGSGRWSRRSSDAGEVRDPIPRAKRTTTVMRRQSPKRCSGRR